MKTKEELNVLKEEVEALNTKLAVLTEEELAQVCGGSFRTTKFSTGWPSTLLAMARMQRIYFRTFT